MKSKLNGRANHRFFLLPLAVHSIKNTSEPFLPAEKIGCRQVDMRINYRPKLSRKTYHEAASISCWVLSEQLRWKCLSRNYDVFLFQLEVERRQQKKNGRSDSFVFAFTFCWSFCAQSIRRISTSNGIEDDRRRSMDILWHEHDRTQNALECM